MSEADNTNVNQKFWIPALAFSIVLLAGVVALASNYLVDIRNNTAAASEALMRVQDLKRRIDLIDIDQDMIQHRLMMNKPQAAAAAPATGPETIPAELVKDVTPSATTGTLPAIQTPALAPTTKDSLSAPTVITPSTAAVPTVVVPTTTPAKP